MGNFSVHTDEADVSFNEVYRKVPLTAKMVFRKAVAYDLEIATDWFEWAAELMQAGYAHPAIVGLSQESEESGQVRLMGLVNVVFDALKIDFNRGDLICKYFASYIIETGMKDNDEVIDILSRVNYLFIETKFPPLYDFHVLFSAYMDLREEGEQKFWKGMNLTNKDDCVKRYFREWLEDPRSRLNDKWEKRPLILKILTRVFCNKYAYLCYLIGCSFLVLAIGKYLYVSGHFVALIAFMAVVVKYVVRFISELIKARDRLRRNK